ncbi:MAG: GIY-YIG nuclease family protein [Cyanobacteria bacterium SID2]|nr:GIY-YIG nuclease family protein [Cyanobacteria bacterium SID2]MBP0005745.1 GIY-YIG nuclease family protein [Cyanobacteria bacterium SBC]
MATQTDVLSLSDLPLHPYLDENGLVADRDVKGQVGVYAIFNDDRVLQYIGYSRNIALSLRQHLVRRPQQCHGFKVQTIDRPSRTILETIRQAWIVENGSTPPGNSDDESSWSAPIDVKPRMTDEERKALENAIDEQTRTKRLKSIARRVESEILQELETRGVTEQLRFNPKLKETGLLDLK